MYVCCCNAVTDREVAQAIDGGATTRSEVTRACGAGGDCGACHGAIEEMLEARGCGGHQSHAPHVQQAHHAHHASSSAPPEVAALVPAAALLRGRAA
jgi:bacterioferritin-associated ferredoxin